MLRWDQLWDFIKIPFKWFYWNGKKNKDNLVFNLVTNLNNNQNNKINSNVIWIDAEIANEKNIKKIEELKQVKQI